MIKVDYIDHMGSDLTVVNAARVSFGSDSKTLTDKDKKLIAYLAKHKHMTPFEHCALTIKITCPLYIRTQIMRHRTFAYNEISRRYTTKDIEIYKPNLTDMRKQSTDNKQCSEGLLSDEDSLACDLAIQASYSTALKSYETLISKGLSREQARGVLPQNLMTEFYMTGNLRNFTHFLGLRLGKDAQMEAQTVAIKIRDVLLDKFEYSAEVLMEV